MDGQPQEAQNRRVFHMITHSITIFTVPPFAILEL